MNAIRVFRNAAQQWVTESQTPVCFLSVDKEDTFRSIGLHPKGGLCIAVDAHGHIDNVTLFNGEPVTEFHIPVNHGLYLDLANTPV